MHPLTWEEVIKHKASPMEDMDDMSYVCKTCEKDVKRHIRVENCQPYCRAKTKTLDSCISPACSTSEGIIHTSLVVPQNASELVQTTAFETTEGKLTPLCQIHYKYIHRL